MPTQKVFKHRVRERMSKTGESYTSARRQLIHKAAGASEPIEPAAAAKPEVVEPGVMLVADESMVSATGRTHAEWFAILDAWGATDHSHTEIARWLGDEQGVPPWWTQNVTVAYERARGMRARHQMADGFSVSVTRTVGVSPERAIDAFVDAERRAAWLPDAPLTQRPTTAALTRRFDWTDPPSRVVVTVTAKGPGRSVVAVALEKLPDAATGDRLKTAWRGWLTALKSVLEGD
ncbi:MAG TPA: hypothetical protein VF119_09500 [Candidatus Limnocylindrales bacterium]